MYRDDCEVSRPGLSVSDRKPAMPSSPFKESLGPAGPATRPNCDQQVVELRPEQRIEPNGCCEVDFDLQALVAATQAATRDRVALQIGMGDVHATVQHCDGDTSVVARCRWRSSCTAPPVTRIRPTQTMLSRRDMS
jgi:hypothetical protein